MATLNTAGKTARKARETNVPLSPGALAKTRAAAHEAVLNEAVRLKADRRANAFPLFDPAADVSADVRGWHYGGARVVRDAGPASDGGRQITLERHIGRRVGERVTVRRDRVMVSRNPVPGQ